MNFIGRLFRNSRGFTLVEILISLGVLGGLGVGVGQLMKLQAKGARFSDYHMSALEAMYDVAQTLRDKGACTRTLQSSTIGNNNFSVLPNAGAARYRVGDIVSSLGNITINPQPGEVAAGKLRIESIAVTRVNAPIGANPSNEALQLVMTFSRRQGNGAVAAGDFSGNIVREVDLQAFTDGGNNVQSCYVEEDAMLLLVCESIFRGRYIPQTTLGANFEPGRCRELTIAPTNAGGNAMRVRGDLLTGSDPASRAGAIPRPAGEYPIGSGQNRSGRVNTNGNIHIEQNLSVSGNLSAVGGSIDTNSETRVTTARANNMVNVSGRVNDLQGGVGNRGFRVGGQILHSWPEGGCGGGSIVRRIYLQNGEVRYECGTYSGFRENGCYQQNGFSDRVTCNSGYVMRAARTHGYCVGKNCYTGAAAYCCRYEAQ